MHVQRRFANFAFLTLLLALCSAARAGVAFEQTNLTSSDPNVLAAFHDPNLKNPWGISHSGASPFWVSDQVTGVSTLYNGAGQPFPTANPLVVTIPSAPSGGPTGQVFNSTASDFVLSNGTKATFLFANLNGTLSGWNGAAGTTALFAQTVPGGELTGLALGNNGSGNLLYAADEGNTKIDVFDNAFNLTSLPGSFTDPTLPAGFKPYNIQNINNTLYVTYENETSGGGVVSAFDLNGNFLRQLTANAGGGVLASPWGLTLAPAGFGAFGGALLVGNEDNGHIAAFNPATGKFLGLLEDPHGNPITNSGLWGLSFGTGAQGFDPNTLYFAAGIEDETQGLFGAIAAVSIPEPSSLLLMLGALAMVVSMRSCHRRAIRGNGC